MADKLLTRAEAASYLGFTEKSLQWRATNANCNHPVPSVMVPRPDTGRLQRLYERSALDEWREGVRRPGRRRKTGAADWPPTRRDLVFHVGHGAPEPDPKDFPDPVDPEPYVDLAGRVVRPGWLTCMCGCGGRFLSPDRTRVRFLDDCREALAGPNVVG